MKNENLLVGNEKLTKVLVPYLNKYKHDVLDLIIGKLESIVSDSANDNLMAGSTFQEVISYLKLENALWFNCSITKDGDEKYNELFRYFIQNTEEFNLFNTYENEEKDFANFIICEQEFAKIKDEKMKDIADSIIQETKKKVGLRYWGGGCCHCGSYTLNHLPYTYRTHFGTTGRSYECPICSGLNDIGIRMVDTQYKKGGMKAVSELFELLTVKEQLTLDETLKLIDVPADTCLNLVDFIGDKTVIDNGYLTIYRTEYYYNPNNYDGKIYESQKYYVQVDTPITILQLDEMSQHLDLIINVDDSIEGYEPNINQFTGDHNELYLLKTPKDDTVSYQPLSQFITLIQK